MIVSHGRAVDDKRKSMILHREGLEETHIFLGSYRKLSTFESKS